MMKMKWGKEDGTIEIHFTHPFWWGIFKVRKRGSRKTRQELTFLIIPRFTCFRPRVSSSVLGLVSCLDTQNGIFTLWTEVVNSLICFRIRTSSHQVGYRLVVVTDPDFTLLDEYCRFTKTMLWVLPKSPSYRKV